MSVARITAILAGGGGDSDRTAVRGQHDRRRLAIALGRGRESALGQCDAAGDRGVATERDLGQRAEVADTEPPGEARTVGGEEGRLRVAHLGGDALHLGVGGEHLADPDTGRVAAARIGRERRQPQERATADGRAGRPRPGEGSVIGQVCRRSGRPERTVP